MPDKLPPQPDPLAPHFAALRENLPHSPLLDPTFTHRLANTTIRPKPLIPIHPALISIVILIFILIFILTPLLLLRTLAPAKKPPLTLTPATLNLDGLLITQRLACTLDPNTVVIVWTTHGAVDPAAGPSHHHGYREIPVRYIPLPSGDTLHCSLFIADPDVYPQLTPPTIIASLPTGQTIGFAASPTYLPSSALDRALQSAVSTPAGPATFITSNELQSVRLTHTSLSI